ncbi:hypothetical protein LS684_10570 [Cytobacillus spongiae]|uniref:hypothetical protein n=1 Tax=Cytobacillus spongiae TaxID=2901381 RepID=UPI001F40BDC2|nr:hypothetical protein [Cytobacillus spongiae]UII57904.1 hypothetical protein LS684_10570 [Cytobacillus spongiae]
MKKELLFAFASFFFMSLSAITGVYAIEENKKEATISKDQVDVTGDQIKDTIYVKGTPFDNKASFLKEIKLEIVASNQEHYTIKLDGGYEPTIVFQDLNQDGVVDIFVTVPTGGSGGLSQHYLYSLKDFSIHDLTVPDPLLMQAQFLDHYKANLTINETGKTYQFDLQNRKEEYNKMGLYVNEKLNEPQELMVHAYGLLKPIKLEDGSVGLKGVQRVSGAYNADAIAFVESIWKLDHGKWKLLGADVMEIK